jgi:hypothetical protein
LWFTPCSNSSSFIFTFLSLFSKLKFCIWKKTCYFWLSESGLFRLTWWYLVLPIFLQMTPWEICVQVCILYADFDSFVCMYRSGRGLYHSSILNNLRNLNIGFHSVCTNFHSHQLFVRLPFSPLQHLLLFAFLIMAILIRVRWNLVSFWYSFFL